MSDSTLHFDTDPLTGRVRTFHILPDDTYAIASAVDVEPVLEQNKAVRDTLRNDWKGDWHWVGGIPLPIYFGLRRQWKKLKLSTEEIQQEIHKIMNDPDYKSFRVKPGRV